MNPMQMMQMLTSLKSNPMSFLASKGLNLPQVINDPEQMVKHLINSGQINQNAINQAIQMANQMGIKM